MRVSLAVFALAAVGGVAGWESSKPPYPSSSPKPPYPTTTISTAPLTTYTVTDVTTTYTTICPVTETKYVMELQE